MKPTNDATPKPGKVLPRGEVPVIGKKMTPEMKQGYASVNKPKGGD